MDERSWDFENISLKKKSFAQVHGLTKKKSHDQSHKKVTNKSLNLEFRTWAEFATMKILKKDKTASDIKIGSMTYDLKTKHPKKIDTFSKFSQQKGRIIIDDYDKIWLGLSDDTSIFFSQPDSKDMCVCTWSFYTSTDYISKTYRCSESTQTQICIR